MAELIVKKEDLASLAGKTVVITGGSSGIGLATVELLLELGALVLVGDQQPIPISHDGLSFQETDVLSWPSLLALFNKALELHGHVDHVFANAGIGGFRADYLASSLDSETGELLEPSSLTLDVNLKAVINTAYLGMHHMRQQGTPGSVVLTASASSLQRFRNADYATAKHGVLGFMRGVVPNLQAQNLPVRVNCIAPTFTRTGMVGVEGFQGTGREHLLQEPAAVAKSTAVLMADEGRQGQVVYSAGGRLWEIEESILLPTVAKIVGIYDEDVTMAALMKFMAEKQAEEEAKKGAEEAEQAEQAEQAEKAEKVAEKDEVESAAVSK